MAEYDFGSDQTDQNQAPETVAPPPPRVPKGFRVIESPRVASAPAAPAPPQPRVPKGFRLSTPPPEMDDHAALGQRSQGNLDPFNRPMLQNPDGGYSTTSSISVGTDKGETIIPTVVGGKRLSNEDAMKHYRETGENFGAFDTPENADVYAQHLHEVQAEDVERNGAPASWSDIATTAVGRGLKANMRSGLDPEVEQAPSPVDQRYSAPFDLGTMPNGETAKKVTYKTLKGLTEYSPEMAGAVAGGITGNVAAPGPIGTAVGAGLGAAAVHTAKATVPIFQHELKATPNDPDGAFNRALAKLAIEDAGTAASFAAFEFKPFAGAVKSLLFQALGVQPTIAGAEKAATNLVDDKPVLQDVPEAMVESVPATVIPAIPHVVTSAARGRRGAAATESPPPDEPPAPPPAGLPPPGPENRPPGVDATGPVSEAERAASFDQRARTAKENVQQRATERAAGPEPVRDAKGAVIWTDKNGQRVPPGTEGAQPVYQPGEPTDFVAPSDRAPQTRSDVASQREAGEAFDVTERQRERLEENPDSRDTQAAGRPEGFNAQEIHLDDGFPVEIVERRMVPDAKGNMVEVAKVRRYDPRTGKAEDGAVEYDVPVRQLKKKAYPNNPNMAADFRERANVGKVNKGAARGQRADAVQGLPEQTFRTTPEDASVPGADGPASEVRPTRPYDKKNLKPGDPESGFTPTGERVRRSPFPEQPEGPMPGREKPRTEEDFIKDFERRQQEEASRAQDEEARAKREAESQTYADAEDTFSSHVADKGADGFYATDAHGYVKSKKGGPVRWTQKQKKLVGKLIVKMHQDSPNQSFELDNHPGASRSTGPRSSEGYLTIRETERRAPTEGEKPAGEQPQPKAGKRPPKTGTFETPPFERPGANPNAPARFEGGDQPPPEPPKGGPKPPPPKGKGGGAQKAEPRVPPGFKLTEPTPAPKKSAPAPKAPPRPRNIIDAIKSHGGIKPSGETKSRRLQRYPGLVDGKGLDENVMMQRLGEDGFFPFTEREYGAQTGVDSAKGADREMWRMIDDHTSGRATQYHPHDSHLVGDWEDHFKGAADHAEAEAAERHTEATAPDEHAKITEEHDSEIDRLVREVESGEWSAGRDRAGPEESSIPFEPTATDRQAKGVQGVGDDTRAADRRPDQTRTGGERVGGPDAEARSGARDGEGGSRAREQSADEAVKPSTEKIDTVDGKREQGVMPGMEQSAKQAAQVREKTGRGKIVPKAPQKEANDGMFAPKPDDRQGVLADTAPVVEKPGVRRGNEEAAASTGVSEKSGRVPKSDVPADKPASEPKADAKVERIHPIPKKEIDKAIDFYKRGGDPYAYIYGDDGGGRLTETQLDRIFADEPNLKGIFDARTERADRNPTLRETRITSAHRFVAKAWIEKHILLPMHEETVRKLADHLRESEDLSLYDAMDKARDLMRSEHSGRPPKHGTATLAEVAQKIRQWTERNRAEAAEKAAARFSEEASKDVVDLSAARAAKGTRENPATPKNIQDARDRVDHDATPAQKAANNYEHGHVRIQGMDIAIETAKGKERTSHELDENGKPKWSVEMPVDYGYIKRTEGADGEGVDVFIGPKPEGDKVWVVDQQHADTKAFDEHKVMLGFESRAEALKAYKQSFSDGKGWARIKSVTEMTVAKLKETLNAMWQKKPIYKGKPSERGGVRLFDTPEEKAAKAAAKAEARKRASRMPAQVSQARHGPLRKLADAYAKRAEKLILEPLHKTVGWRFDALGRLPWKEDYMVKRYLTLGKVANIEKTIDRIYKSLRGASPEVAKQVYDYLTTPNARATNIPEPFRAAAIEVKQTIDQIGHALVARDMMTEESRQKYAGGYLPRVYLKHILGDDNMRAMGGGKLPDLGYLKKRTDIDEETRMLILGEIQDPAFLGARGIGIPQRDIAILDFLRDVAENKEWALPESLVDWKGKKVSAVWLKGEAKRIAEMATYLDHGPGTGPGHNMSSVRDEAIAMSREMARVADAVLDFPENVPDRYRQVPDTNRYGQLRGLWIRKEIYDDLIGGARLLPRDVHWIESLLTVGGYGTKLTQLWKMSKVSLNVPSQVRNFMSNGLLLQLSGVPMHKVPSRIFEAVTEMKNDGPYWRVAQKYGVKATTFSSSELNTIHSELRDLKAREGTSWDKMRNFGSIIAKTAGDVYGLSESIFKTARIIHAMKHEGIPEAKAALLAHKSVFDYSLLPRGVRALRDSPIGIPFVTFTYKAAGMMIETAAKAPWRFAPYVALAAGLNELLQQTYDVTKEDLDHLMKALPEWLEEKGGAYLLPWKDEQGRWQMIDLGYLFPWQNLQASAQHAAAGEPLKAMDDAGMFGGPIADIVAAVKTGIDPFTKKPIADPHDPPAKRLRSIMSYVWGMAAPNWVTDQGAAGRIYDSWFGTGKTKSGDPAPTKTQSALRLPGINVYPIEPEKTRNRNLDHMEFEIKQTEINRNRVARDKSLSPEKRKAQIKEFNDYLRQLDKQYKDYAKASKVHPNLRTTRPTAPPP